MFNIMPYIATGLLYLIGWTLRLSEKGNTEVSPRAGKVTGVIYAFWHSRIITSVFYYRKKNINVLISLGRDGEFISRVISNFGYIITRGSTSKEGFRAFIGMKKNLVSGHSVVVTPDGPRGPKQVAQAGAIFLARISGKPIVPFAFDVDRKWVLNSWDNFIIPKPFAKGVFILGKEIFVPEDADEMLLEQKRKELEAEINRLMQEAGAACRS